MKILVLIDGEHYPPVTRWGIASATASGHEVVGAVFLGGTEKVTPGPLPDFGVEVVTLPGHNEAALQEAISRFSPEAVLDLSDEPVLGYRERFSLIGVALAAGITYLGADFRFDPPSVGAPLRVPAVAVIGTGKRTGKTAVSGQLARLAEARGLRPVVVAMGRGGPAAPQVAPGGTIGLPQLMDILRRGHHAASDYLEDAVTSGVPTVGARRAGGGLAGAVYASNAEEAAQIAVAQGAGIVILESSGSAVPPVPWDAAVLVAPADVPHEDLHGYLGPYRLLRSDLLVATMCSSVESGASFPLGTTLLQRYPHLRLAVTDFEPLPLGEVSGATVFLASTAPAAVVAQHAAHLERRYDCTVVASSPDLSNRSELTRAMESAPDFQILCTELKAAAVDVAAGLALARGAQVVFVDNRMVDVDGDVDDELGRILDLAVARAAANGVTA